MSVEVIYLFEKNVKQLLNKNQPMKITLHF